MKTRSASSKDDLYIFGAGGSGRETAWLAEECGFRREGITFVVNRSEYLRDQVNGIPVRLLEEVAAGGGGYVVAVGDPSGRARCVNACTAAGLSPVTLIHPRTERSALLDVGEGTIVCAGTVITTNVRIGAHVQINVGCTVSHDAVLEDFVTLSPGVHIAGYVHVRNRAFLGTGAVIINGDPQTPLIVGEHAVVAAGACVTRSVDPGALVAGVPAVRKR